MERAIARERMKNVNEKIFNLANGSTVRIVCTNTFIDIYIHHYLIFIVSFLCAGGGPILVRARDAFAMRLFVCKSILDLAITSKFMVLHINIRKNNNALHNA